MKTYPLFTGAALLCFSFVLSATDKTQKLISDGVDRLKENSAHQQKVTASYEQTRALEKQYLEQLKLVDGLKMYNDLLAHQLADQDDQITKLNHSISNTTLIERQIVPLLVRMVDALENFTSIDVPFLAKERQDRVANLRALIRRADLTASEKTRRVFEAYQIENEYGYTIESYKGNVNVDGSQFAVDFLRIGRVALMYKDVSGEKVGFWNSNSNKWQALTDSQYKRHIAKGIRIANEEMAPELITIPLLANKEVR